jgi:light-regulated signal transduction histidine kinase (bacteriophytochrome)
VSSIQSDADFRPKIWIGPKLQSISNVCYLIVATDREKPTESKTMLAQLSASVTAMSNTIDDLLDLSRSTSAVMHLTRLDLSLLASSILEVLAKADPDRHVVTVVHPRCSLNADPGLMQIVLQNLLRNAWKFTGRPDPAQIEFGCEQKNGMTVFYFRDNGAGFDPQMADRLFKPFQRLHAVSEFPGTALDWPRCSASFAATEERCGRRAKLSKERRSISPWIRESRDRSRSIHRNAGSGRQKSFAFHALMNAVAIFRGESVI